MAGRDVIVNNSGMPTSLGKLIKKYQEETENDQTLKGFIEELSLFAKQVPDEPMQGLEDKLQAADRSDEIYDALQLKELVYESLKTNIGSQSFQKIYAYLMAQAKERFRTYVRPLIEQGAERSQIDQKIFEEVLSPILVELESCGAAHDFTIQTIKGMVYFLAGNCHVRWN